MKLHSLILAAAVFSAASAHAQAVKPIVVAPDPDFRVIWGTQAQSGIPASLAEGAPTRPEFEAPAERASAVVVGELPVLEMVRTAFPTGTAGTSGPPQKQAKKKSYFERHPRVSATLEYVALAAVMVPLMPLILLESILGWDGC